MFVLAVERGRERLDHNEQPAPSLDSSPLETSQEFSRLSLKDDSWRIVGKERQAQLKSTVLRATD